MSAEQMQTPFVLNSPKATNVKCILHKHLPPPLQIYYLSTDEYSDHSILLIPLWFGVYFVLYINNPINILFATYILVSLCRNFNIVVLNNPYNILHNVYPSIHLYFKNSGKFSGAT